MDEIALARFQRQVRAYYDMFTGAVAEYRGTDIKTVHADPEAAASSFGGGRAYTAPELRKLKLIGRRGMVDRVETMRETVGRLMGATAGSGSRRNRARARLDLTTRSI